jgi:hypothetical protein
MKRSFVLLLAAGLCGGPGDAFAWGTGHRILTRAALEVMPEALRIRWERPHRHPVSGEEQSIAAWLVGRFCMHPDWVDGPSSNGSDIAERKRTTQFVYAEQNGRYFPPVAWADPDRDPSAPRPWTYHYFTRPVEEVNRAFAEAGAVWYLTRIAAAFREGRDAEAAEYAGAFAHAIEDRVSPFHVWDGYREEREALEDSLAAEGLQDPGASRDKNAKNSSVFWGIDGPGMKADLAGYAPSVLGTTVEEAAEVFTRRLFASREFAKQVYTRRDGFLAAHLADDWRNLKGGPATDRALSEVATENAKLVADVFLTASQLAGVER